MDKEQETKSLSFVDNAKHHFNRCISEGTPIYPYFPRHVKIVEHWAKILLPYFPGADGEIVMMAVQLHDIGHADGKYWEDHAVKSEVETIRYLEEIGYPKEKISKVAYCVRTHRNKDEKPRTPEAIILMLADSASHITDFVYIEMLGQSHLTDQDVLKKLERDYRDTELLPDELKHHIQTSYEAWKKLIPVMYQIISMKEISDEVY